MNDELAWVLQAQQGNDEAFTKLVEEHQTHVYNLCYRMLGEPEAAEDAAQETFLRALGAQYHADGRERAWVFQIARNLARDHVRAGARRPVLVVLDDVQPLQHPTPALEIERALSQLAADDREVFLLKEVAGLNYAEIADACGLSPDAVRSRLHRTRLTLRAALSAPAPLARVQR